MDKLSSYQWNLTAKEVLMQRDAQYPLDYTLMQNLARLLAAMNYIRYKYGKPMVVSSGYRPGIYNKQAGGASNSAHMTCEAVDIQDRDGKLAVWVLANLDIMEEAGLWIEDPHHTEGWVHFDIRPRKNRVFIP